LQYIKYKYKGSTVKLDFGFDKFGQLIYVGVPQFLNVPHLKLFEIISGMFLQSVRNLYFNAMLPQSINAMAFEDSLQMVENAMVQNFHVHHPEVIVYAEGVTITN